MRTKTLIAMLCAIVLLGTTTLTASAHSGPPKKHPAPLSFDNCINITATVKAADDITAVISGSVDNVSCNSDVTGTLRIYANITCGGSSKTGAPAPESLPVPYGDGVAYSGAATGTCVVCTNGIVTDTPRFSLTLYASYTGKDHNNLTVGGTSPTRTVGLTNDPGLIGKPCPV